MGILEGTHVRIFSNIFGKSLTYSYLCSVIYPNNFEQKIGFDEIRELLKARCLSTLGKEKVDEILNIDTPIPERLAAFMRGEKQSVAMTKDFADFKAWLMKQ